MSGIRSVLCLLLGIYWAVLLAHVIFSWVPRPPEPLLPFVRGVRRLVDPVAEPLRRTIPGIPLGASGVRLDLSILVLFFGVIILQGIVCP